MRDTPYPPNHPPARILLCASPTHCVQVLHAAAQARIPLHGLLPMTQWPTPDSAPSGLLLWALLPDAAPAPYLSTEADWRTRQLPHSCWPVHMLYGSAAQQARQLHPWVSQAADSSAQSMSNNCQECLDAASERQLFRHLLQEKTGV